MNERRESRGAVLVTGGARRIGRAVAEALAGRGWRVLVHSREAREGWLQADFSEPGAAGRLFAAAVSAAPDLCAIVNNASVFPSAEVLTPEETENVMRVNAEVPAELAALLSERMARSGATGSVVNLLDSRVLRVARAACGGTPYSLSKKILAEWTVECAVRFAPHVRVNGVAPGPALRPADPANHEKGGPVLLGRRPHPEEVAAAVAFLLEAESVTGEILAVDSGQSLLRGKEGAVA